MFSYKNSKGKTYYLHNKGKLFFFSSKQAGAIDLPSGYGVIESKATGLPLVKKKL